MSGAAIKPRPRRSAAAAATSAIAAELAFEAIDDRDMEEDGDGDQEDEDDRDDQEDDDDKQKKQKRSEPRSVSTSSSAERSMRGGSRKRSHASVSSVAASASSSVNSPRSSKKRKTESPQQPLTNYDMEGPVFDTCNEVRRKIRAHLRKPGNTIAAFLRELGGVNSNSYRQFMSMKDPMQGSGNRIYPAAYHYFEKERLVQGKKKSKLRLESEAAFSNGHSLSPTYGRCLVPQGMVPVMDKLGRVSIIPSVPRPRRLSLKQLEKLLAHDDQQ